MQRVSHELAEHTGKCGGLYKIIWVLIRLGGPTILEKFFGPQPKEYHEMYII